MTDAETEIEKVMSRHLALVQRAKKTNSFFALEPPKWTNNNNNNNKKQNGEQHACTQ
jgi:hypothetical protein